MSDREDLAREAREDRLERRRERTTRDRHPYYCACETCLPDHEEPEEEAED